MASRMFLVLLFFLVSTAQASQGWPDRVVTVEQVRLRSPLAVTVPTFRAVDRSKSIELVLHIAVDETGHPTQVHLEKSSGMPSLDEAVIHAVRKARFEPYVEDGRALPVTLVMPMHFPFRERR